MSSSDQDNRIWVQVISDQFVIIFLIVSFVDYAGIRFSGPRTLNERFFNRERYHEAAVKRSRTQ